MFLAKAKALNRVRRGVVQITHRGKQLRAENHPKITIKVLKRFPEFRQFHIGTDDNGAGGESVIKDADGSETPEEQLEASFSALQGTLAGELLEAVKKSAPEFFEALVMKLLVAMGYGVWGMGFRGGCR